MNCQNRTREAMLNQRTTMIYSSINQIPTKITTLHANQARVVPQLTCKQYNRVGEKGWIREECTTYKYYTSIQRHFRVIFGSTKWLNPSSPSVCLFIFGQPPPDGEWSKWTSRWQHTWFGLSLGGALPLPIFLVYMHASFGRNNVYICGVGRCSVGLPPFWPVLPS